MQNLIVRFVFIFFLMGVWAYGVEAFPSHMNSDTYLRGLTRNLALLIPMLGLINRQSIRSLNLNTKSWLLMLLGWSITLVISCTPMLSGEPITIARWSNFVLLSPFLEEVVFRGYYLPILVDLIGRTKAVILSSALFSLMHLPQFLIFGYEPALILQNLGFIAVLGSVFGVLTLMTKRLWPSTLLHAANNCLAFV